jgi:hypothetical protein
MNKKRSRTRKRLAKLFLLFAGFFCGATLAEIMLRVTGYSYPEFYVLNQVRGYALRPGAAGWYRKEGEAYVRINSDGLHDQEHTTAKAADTFRIALLGDSYPEAFPVPLEQSFWWVMADQLRQCHAFPAANVEVINFGVSGYGTAQELLTLREQVWKYAPDLVLLAVTTNNDITDNLRALKQTDEIPYFVYQDNQLKLDQSFQTTRTFSLRQSRISRLGRWLRDNSRLVQAVMQGHHGFKVLLSSWRAKRSPAALTPSNPPAADPPQKSDLLSRSEELGTDNLIYLEPANAVWNDAWTVTEKLIVELRDEVKNGGAQFAVITLSNGPQVLPNPAAREQFKQRFGITDLFYPDERIKALGAREGIPVITLAPELQEFAQRNNVFLHGFGDNLGNGHWNSTGHRAAGELIAKKICEGGLPK